MTSTAVRAPQHLTEVEYRRGVEFTYWCRFPIAVVIATIATIAKGAGMGGRHVLLAPLILALQLQPGSPSGPPDNRGTLGEELWGG